MTDGLTDVYNLAGFLALGKNLISQGPRVLKGWPLNWADPNWADPNWAELWSKLGRLFVRKFFINYLS